jgi:hypothetical protein
VSKIQQKRPQFKHESEVKDPVTGEKIKLYSPIKRLARQLLQVPFAIAAAIVLGSLIATCFGIEIFISEVYGGPFKAYLVGKVPNCHKHALKTIDILTYRHSHHCHAYTVSAPYRICV